MNENVTPVAKQHNFVTITSSALAMSLVAGALALAVPSNAAAKGGQKDVPPATTPCDPITSFSAIPGQQIGGYGIAIAFSEAQCVSGKTITKITGTNLSTGQVEMAVPQDFDRNAVIFYGVRANTPYEIKLTILSARDNSVIGTKSIVVTTGTPMLP